MSDASDLAQAILAAAIIVSRRAKSDTELTAAWTDAKNLKEPQAEQPVLETVSLDGATVRRVDGRPAVLVTSPGNGDRVARIRVDGKERLMTIVGWNALPAWDGPLPS